MTCFLFTLLVFSCISSSSFAWDNLNLHYRVNDQLGSDLTESYPGRIGLPTTRLLSIVPPLSEKQGCIFYLNAEAQEVDICIYNQQGEEVVSLVDEIKTSGLHKTQWDGCNKQGLPVAGGAYFLLLKTDTTTKLCRMTISR